MIRVFKYVLSMSMGVQPLEMPRGARILACQMQNGRITLWAAVYEGVVTERRSFQVYGTGEPIADVPAHVGTVQSRGCVWHVFETTRKGGFQH